MKLFAQGTCLKPNNRDTPVPARRAHPCRAAHAQGYVLLLCNLALGELFEARLTFDRHPPLQLRSTSMDAAAITFMEDLGVISTPVVHSSNWGMEEQHNGPHSFRSNH